MNKTVTIVVPVFDVSDYIERCVESVMYQTYKYLECIIVDDASPDDSITKCNRMISSYRGHVKFRIIHHKQNKRLSASRNTGIKAATGMYLFFLDSDDALSSDCIEKLISPILGDSNTEMVIGNFLGHSEGRLITPGRQQRDNAIVGLSDVRDYYFNGKYYSTAWNKLVKKVFIEQHNLYFKEGVLWEDTLWSFFVVKYLCQLRTVSDVTYHHYKRPHSITTGISKSEKARNMGLVYDEIGKNFTSGEDAREAMFFYKNLCYYLIQKPDYRFYKAAQSFRKALSDGNHEFAVLLLYLTVFFSKTSVGRWFLGGIITVRRFFKEMKNK